MFINIAGKLDMLIKSRPSKFLQLDSVDPFDIDPFDIDHNFVNFNILETSV